MAWERVHILHALGLPRCRSRTTHATTERNAHTGDLPLKWPKHQLFIAIKVKTRPVQVIQLVEQERGKLRTVGNKIAFISQQRLQLRAQHGIAIKAAAGLL